VHTTEAKRRVRLQAAAGLPTAVEDVAERIMELIDQWRGSD